MKCTNTHVFQKQTVNDNISKLIHVLCNVNDEMGANIVHGPFRNCQS